MTSCSTDERHPRDFVFRGAEPQSGSAASQVGCVEVLGVAFSFPSLCCLFKRWKWWLGLFFPQKQHLKNVLQTKGWDGFLSFLSWESARGTPSIRVSQIGPTFILTGSSHSRIGWHQARGPNSLCLGFFSALLCNNKSSIDFAIISWFWVWKEMRRWARSSLIKGLIHLGLDSSRAWVERCHLPWWGWVFQEMLFLGRLLASVQNWVWQAPQMPCYFFSSLNCRGNFPGLMSLLALKFCGRCSFLSSVLGRPLPCPVLRDLSSKRPSLITPTTITPQYWLSSPTPS